MKGMQIDDLIPEYWNAILAQREEILRAFVAKYGKPDPTAVIQVVEHTATGSSWRIKPIKSESTYKTSAHYSDRLTLSMADTIKLIQGEELTFSGLIVSAVKSDI